MEGFSSTVGALSPRERFGSFLREQKPATQKKRGCSMLQKGGVGVWETNQFIRELCILKSFYGPFHSGRMKNSLQVGKWTQCHHVQASTTPSSRPGWLWCLLLFRNLHNKLLSLLYWVRGNLWGCPERCAGKVSDWRPGSPTKQLEVAGNAGVLYLKKSLKLKKKNTKNKQWENNSFHCPKPHTLFLQSHGMAWV